MPRKKIDEAVDEGHVKRDKNENWLEEEHAEWFVQKYLVMNALRSMDDSSLQGSC